MVVSTFRHSGTGGTHGWRADWGEENRNLTKGILILFSNEIFILSDSVTIIKEHRRTFLRGDKGWWRGKIFPWVGKSSQGWENLPMSGKTFSTDYTENSTRMVAREKIFPWVGRFSHDWEDLPNHVSMWKTKRSLLRRDSKILAVEISVSRGDDDVTKISLIVRLVRFPIPCWSVWQSSGVPGCSRVRVEAGTSSKPKKE